MTRKAKNETNYQITVDYGYDIHSVVISYGDLERIQRGEPIQIEGQGFYVEGVFTRDVWNFNYSESGSLEVDGENGFQIFIGRIIDAKVTEYKK